MSRRGRGGGRRKEKDVWDVEGGYMGMKKQKLEEQFKEQVCSTFTDDSPETIQDLYINFSPGKSGEAGWGDFCRSCNICQRKDRPFG